MCASSHLQVPPVSARHAWGWLSPPHYWTRTFLDGVFFVDLAPIRDPQLVPTAIAQSIGLKDVEHDRSLLDTLKFHLRDCRMLIVLDNFEQVLSAAPAIIELLTNCLLLKIVVTSREPLHLTAEQQYLVQPLEVPDMAQLPTTAPILIDELCSNSAVSLFLSRAQSADLTFEVTADNALDVAAMCVRLDGLPLAIELVASCINLMSPRALLARFLGGSDTENTERFKRNFRLQVLRQALAICLCANRRYGMPGWSFDLLNKAEQTLFARLSVFAGGSPWRALTPYAMPIQTCHLVLSRAYRSSSRRI